MVESVREVLAREATGGEVSVRGWLRTARHSKDVSFLEVADGSCFAGLQVVAAPELANFEEVRRSVEKACERVGWLALQDNVAYEVKPGTWLARNSIALPRLHHYQYSLLYPLGSDRVHVTLPSSPRWHRRHHVNASSVGSWSRIVVGLLAVRVGQHDER